MSYWRNYHIYYTNVDDLILECVYPLLQRKDPLLETCFWERHYAGGAHLRVRLRGSDEAINGVGAELVRQARQFITERPSVPSLNYSEDAARKLLEMEQEAPYPDDLTYRVDAIIERPYQRLDHKSISDEAAALLEDFLHDCMPLAVIVLSQPQLKVEQMLRLYFFQALFVNGSLPHGCVSYKSHWEGFALLSAPAQLSERIKANYSQQIKMIREVMLEVKENFEGQTLIQHPVLSGWNDLLLKFGEQAKLLLDSGKNINTRFIDTEHALRAMQGLGTQRIKHSRFLSAFYSDERFLVSLQYDRSILWPRILINLLYSFLSVVGLSVVERMSLCYYAHRAVEDYVQYDLTEILQDTINKVMSKQSHRFA